MDQDIIHVDVIGKPTNTDIVTRGRLNKMCKYFRGKAVHIEFEYNNSLGHSWIREADLVYDTFDIHEVRCGGFSEFTVTFKYKDKQVFLQEFPGHSNAYFVGLGHITWLNSGPYCTFKIRKHVILSAIIVKMLARGK